MAVEAQQDRAIEDELCSALNDLLNLPDEAREEGIAKPSDVAFKNAERLLRDMHEIAPRRFEVYPTPDAEIAIDAPDGCGSSVILLCDSNGGALCLVNMNGSHRRRRYSVADTIPDSFVRDALLELERKNV